MARYTDAVCRLCRREGQKLFLKGDRCYTEKCAMASRAYPPRRTWPGTQQGPPSTASSSVRSKGKKITTVLLESQFEGYFDYGLQAPGTDGRKPLSILETRLDNVIYRLGFAMSRAEARQLVGHAISRSTDARSIYELPREAGHGYRSQGVPAVI
jgi:small subunit ribosomal protein S4